MRFKIFQFAIHGNAHRTRRTFYHGFRRMVVSTV
ncbi:Uncharacterised protein [Enterobacter hormaechei]|nr:Uncharacterised protein [Enterobacter hormaechei]